jgi:hypothetical protein
LKAERFMKYYAHSIEGKPVEEWHRLEDHLTPPESSPWQGEAWRGNAAKFADGFGLGNGVCGGVGEKFSNKENILT